MMPISWYALLMIEFKQFTLSRTYLVTIFQEYLTFQGLSHISRQNYCYPVTTNFEINGHGTSEWCLCLDMHWQWLNLNNLPDREHIWLLYRKDTSLFRGFLIFHCKTSTIVLPGYYEFWNKWSWDFCMMPISWYALLMIESK